MALSTLMFIKSSLLDTKALKDIVSIAQFFDSGGPIYGNHDMRGRARLWRIELALNSVFVNAIAFLPVNIQSSIKKVATKLRKFLVR